VPNPQIALSFLYRTTAAQLEIAQALGLPSPPAVADIAAHLPPLNSAQRNVTTNVTFQLLPNTRCHNDEQTWHGVPSAAACEALCAASQPSCGVFSYCPPAGVEPAGGGCSGAHGEPAPQTCWGFDIAQLPNCVTNGTLNGGWTSGVRNGSSPATAVDVWTAFEGAIVLDSDWFALYPLWPAEALDLGPQAAAGSAGGADALRGTAQVSSRVYSDFANGRPVDLFAAAVRAGSNASFPLAWTPQDVLAGLNAYLAGFQGPNLLPYAPGGGIENVGITRAINEMLLQANRWPAPAGEVGQRRPPWQQRRAAGAADDSGYVLSVFPFWPADEPAAFNNLLAKGGFLVSAAYSNATRAVVSPLTVTAAHTLAGTSAAVARLVNPWPASALAVTCGGAAVPVTMDGVVATFTVPVQVACSVAVAA
jgi:hypothetical protein